MAEHELTQTVAKYLDKHLVFILLEFVQEKGLYSEEDIMKSKIALLQTTNLVDFAMDIHKALYNTDEVPPEMKERRSEVVARLRTLQTDADPIIGCLSNPQVANFFRAEKGYNLKFLQDEFKIGPEHIEALYQYARFQFDCGNYSVASDLLGPYRQVCTSSERNMSALWGKLAANILLLNWDEANEDLSRVKEGLEQQNYADPLMLVQQRTWLMHWALFVFWNHENGRNSLIDMFLSPPYLNAIQINAQHLLRYLAVAVLINKRRKNVLKDMVRIIQQEAYEYSDPITEFVECLFVNYDFDGAQQKLIECEKVIDNDFFLTGCKEEFLESARLNIFETFCRIHQCIDIKMLSEKLNMDQEAAEKWIADLILNVRLNAKIDSKAGTVVMGTQTASVHEQLLDKAKNLSMRTFMLANAVVGTGKA